MIEKSQAESVRAQTLTGPAQLEARAAVLTAVELWGRAFDVLSPHKGDIKHALKFTDGFAELAVRAGKPEIAREKLAPRIPATEIERLIRDWSSRVGWQRE